MSSIWRVRRSVTDVKVGGVCGGVAAHWGIDSTLVRVGWALLALTGGIGIVLYAAGWLLVPQEGQERSTADEMFGGSTRGWPREVWIVLVAVASVVSFALFAPVSPFGIGPALVLAVVWYFGFYRGRRRAPRQAPPPAAPPPIPPFRHPGPATPFTEAATAWQDRVRQVREQQTAGIPTAPRAFTSPPWSVPAPTAEATTDERSDFFAQPDPVGLYTEPEPETPAPTVRTGSSPSARRLRLGTVLVLGLALGALGVADALGTTVPVAVYAAVALLVVGLALVAATWWGRARGLLPVGVLLAATAMVGASGVGTAVLEPITHLDEYGTTRLAYSSAASLPAQPDHLDGGELVVDLSSLGLTADASYAARVENGRVEVRVPSGVGVRLRYATQLGQVEAFGEEIGAGTDLSGTRDLVTATAGQPTLTLDLTARHGQVEVVR